MAESLKQPGTMTYIKRGIGYALTSVFALLSGFLIQAEQIMSMDLLLLIVPISLTIPFFIIYSICFHYDPPENIIDDRVLRMQQIDAIKIWLFIGILLSALVVVIYRLMYGAFPSTELIISFLFYGAVFNIYAFLLNKLHHNNGNIYLRHQIAWPTIITIAFSMYFGQHICCDNITYHAFLPIFIVLLFFVVTETFKFTKKMFLVSSFVVFSIFFLAISLGKLDLIPKSTSAYFSSMVFFVPISAYLASFESWRISSYISQLAHYDIYHGDKSNLLKIKDIVYDYFPKGNPAKYYFATLSSLSIAILLIPFVFIFSDYGLIFIITFLFHALISFCYWAKNGDTLNSLSTANWTMKKLIFGFTFLFLLVLDAKFNIQPTKLILSDFVSWSGLSVLLVLSTFPTKKLWNNFEKTREEISTSLKESFIAIYYSRTNYIYSIAPISAFACAFILIVRGLHESPSITLKSNYAFIVYAIFILISFVSYIMLNIISKKEIQKIVTTITGFLLTTRIMTSSLVGLSVLVPSLSKGYSFFASFMASIPFILSAMGGFALNDFFDHEKDKINEPTRAIPSGKISVNNALAFSIILLFLSFLASLSQSDNKAELIIYLYPLIGVSSYNTIVKKFTYLKTIYTSIICVSPLLYDVLIFDYKDIFLVIPLASMLFILGREILMDVKDIPGDSKSGISTIPILIGTKNAEKLGFIFQIIGLFFLVPFIFISNSLNGYLIFTLLVSSVIFSIFLWQTKGNGYHSLIIKSMRLPMLLSLFLLVI